MEQSEFGPLVIVPTWVLVETYRRVDLICLLIGDGFVVELADYGYFWSKVDGRL